MPASCSSLRFAALARHLAAHARELGLAAPAFRSPPRNPSATRSIRRTDHGPIVAVRIRGRSPNEVAEDLIAGIMAVNDGVGEIAALELYQTAFDAGLTQPETIPAH